MLILFILYKNTLKVLEVNKAKILQSRGLLFSTGDKTPMSIREGR